MRFTDSLIGFAVLLTAFTCWINAEGGEAFGTFGFDVHHRYSDKVREFFDIDGLPEKDTLDYFNAMAHRDEFFKARRLATTPASTGLLTFLGSNRTIRISTLGFLHYSFVAVGTPRVPYLVALDTGSDLFWLPCDCQTCARSVNLTSNATLPLNIYSPSTSSSSKPVPCNSPMCGGTRRTCAGNVDACAYQEVYLSANTSTKGILVDDVLHLGTESNPQDPVAVPITLGCGRVQTGDFIDSAGINGLFGLGMDNISVPSILANKGLTANSFSMCFGPGGLGRIEFGDKGSPDQQKTPFNLRSIHPTYNITITRIAVNNNITDLEFTAIFDSGTSFTYLNDPAYSTIVDSFTSQITDPRYQPQEQSIFDFCYIPRNPANTVIPDLNLTMNGGSNYAVKSSIVVLSRQDGSLVYCLAIVKSENVNIIGQNFMAGYRIVFDREEMVLGWKDDECNGSPSGNTLPVDKGNSTGAPPPSIFNPQETPSGTGSPVAPRVPRQLTPPPPSVSLNGSGATAILSCTVNRLLTVLVSLCLYQFIILSS